MDGFFFQISLALLGIVVGIIVVLVGRQAQMRMLLIFGLLLLLSAGIWLVLISKIPYFYEPTSDGYRIDWCTESATGCGKPAAILWCRSQGYTEVVDFTQDPNVGERGIETKTLANGEICDDDVCDSFRSITCK